MMNLDLNTTNPQKSDVQRPYRLKGNRFQLN
jgi:hypothetical protein